MQEYTVTIGGIEHTVQLDADDAKRYPDAKKVSPANKAATAHDDKARAPANKAK